MRDIVCAVAIGLFATVSWAEEMPNLPPSATLLVTATAERDWAGHIQLESKLYIDTGGAIAHFYEVYYLKKHRNPIRLTFREAYGEEVTIWSAPAFADE